VRALLDHLGVARAALAGNSFGGKVALDFALAYPGRTAALVLVAPALTGWEGSAELEAFDEEEDALLEDGQIDEAVELNVRTWLDGPERGPATVPAETQARLATMQREAFETMLRAFDASPPPGPVYWSDPPAATRLDEIAAPTLVVAGAHDVADFRAIAEVLAAGVPGAEHAVLDTAHLPGLEQPDELNRLLLDFLARHAS